ncbi:hypothetical protein E2C01_098595 [Portunus trituberculatus]|uniref:Uncharacterized protein n=1 Tax=Portunus trituberculatus TaxID=210409 RepID=A0A5B7JY79_PORTR|nr:hypothetical protein [Portunus trituberculatus]
MVLACSGAGNRRVLVTVPRYGPLPTPPPPPPPSASFLRPTSFPLPHFSLVHQYSSSSSTLSHSTCPQHPPVNTCPALLSTSPFTFTSPSCLTLLPPVLSFMFPYLYAFVPFSPLFFSLFLW